MREVPRHQGGAPKERAGASRDGGPVRRVVTAIVYVGWALIVWVHA
jgi:hypothetical protein